MDRFNMCIKIIKNNPHIGKTGRKEGTYDDWWSYGNNQFTDFKNDKI